jgi:protein-L-isoaspartate O-methyltransferase
MTSTIDKKEEDHWDSNTYQSAASFVPKLATKVLSWLDVKPDDVILDVGCGGNSSLLYVSSLVETLILFP